MLCRGQRRGRFAWGWKISTLSVDFEEEIARIIRDELLLGSERAIPFDEPLGELGIGLDSLALVNLLSGVEAAFGVELDDGIWTEREPLSVNDLAEILRRTPPTPVSPPSLDRSSPVLHGRLERVEHRLNERGLAGRAVWSAVRAAAPVKSFLFSRTRYLLLERRLDIGSGATVAPPVGVELRPLDPEDESELDHLWAPVHARRSRQMLERALSEGATALVACEGDRILAIDVVSPTGSDEAKVISPDACWGFLLTESREARGRGIGLALAAYSFIVARRLGFRSQLAHVWEGNTAMLAAATQLLGFRTIGSARRTHVAGITRWSWQTKGAWQRGSRLVL
jgi:acyl carrier protein/GNAT superfamily N-acetyltransferase